jgi:hypothetical protein
MNISDKIHSKRALLLHNLRMLTTRGGNKPRMHNRSRSPDLNASPLLKSGSVRTSEPFFVTCKGFMNPRLQPFHSPSSGKGSSVLPIEKHLGVVVNAVRLVATRRRNVVARKSILESSRLEQIARSSRHTYTRILKL